MIITKNWIQQDLKWYGHVAMMNEGGHPNEVVDISREAK